MRDPELVARAQHAAARLELAWERWRALQGLADTPAQPVVGYVGYALKEPWSQPRAVIGFSADEAERLAGLLEQRSSESYQAAAAGQLAGSAGPQAAVPLPVPVPQAAVPQQAVSQSGPQPSFTPAQAPVAQASFAQAVGQSQAAAEPAAVPSAAQRQSGPRGLPEPLSAAVVVDEPTLADLGAERSLPASDAVHRVALASYQKPVSH